MRVGITAQSPSRSPFKPPFVLYSLFTDFTKHRRLHSLLKTRRNVPVLTGCYSAINISDLTEKKINISDLKEVKQLNSALCILPPSSMNK
ncbi:hypothetical protein AVEN_71997-1 [Araneus ventricosus]|uniref:Uncharacterized protein n=1 Tax=Araneus ventricosus TaxID=182803 RepID=A0A4Y2DF97_ARAVE|nr:hypothetical protein AVEN_71997-1 [Araneus ventricosus]